MDLPKLTFPMTVDFCSAGYWIEDQGPFKYGAAVTAFFIDGGITEAANEGISLLRDLERQLQTFGGHLKPYVRGREIDAALFLWPEKQAVACSMCFASYRGRHWGSGGTVCVFFSARFSLCGIGEGYRARQCAASMPPVRALVPPRAGKQAMYCERIAPGEENRTCREAGARMVFEKKSRTRTPGKFIDGRIKNTTPV